MTISVIGVAGSMDTTGFSQVMRRATTTGGRAAYVPTGLAVSTAAGTRTVSVSAGESFQAGTLFTSSATETRTLTANTSTNPRIDVIVAEVDWVLSGGLPSDFSNAGDLKVIAGTPAASPSPPALTQTPGSLWRTPLAYVRVAAGATTISAANITDVRPGANDGAFVACSIQGGWIQGSPQLGVIRKGDVVELAGRIQLTGGAQGVGDSAFFGSVPIIPAGYRPLRTAAVAMATSDNAAAMSLHRLLILDDGTCTCNTLLGTLPTNGSLRVQTTHWLGE